MELAAVLLQFFCTYNTFLYHLVDMLSSGKMIWIPIVLPQFVT